VPKRLLERTSKLHNQTKADRLFLRLLKVMLDFLQSACLKESESKIFAEKSTDL